MSIFASYILLFEGHSLSSKYLSYFSCFLQFCAKVIIYSMISFFYLVCFLIYYALFFSSSCSLVYAQYFWTTPFFLIWLCLLAYLALFPSFILSLYSSWMIDLIPSITLALNRHVVYFLSKFSSLIIILFSLVQISSIFRYSSIFP